MLKQMNFLKAEEEKQEEATTVEKKVEFKAYGIKITEKTQQELFEELEEKQQAIYKKLKELDGVTIEIVGKWLWVDGGTKAHKDELKALGLKFSGPRQKWYLRDSNTTKYRRPSKKSYQAIKDEYNSIIVNDDDK